MFVQETGGENFLKPSYWRGLQADSAPVKRTSA